jgi:hypothetical protein
MSKREEIKSLMAKAIENNHEDLDMAKIEPFSPENQLFYGKNGLILFIAPQGGGKSYTLAEFILMTESIFPKQYFQTIIYCSTNDGLDKTLQTFKEKFKTKIIYLQEFQLVMFLNAYIKRLRKMYSMVTFKKSNGKNISKTLEAQFKKYAIDDRKIKRMDGDVELKFRQRQNKYIEKKLKDYGNPEYPINTLLILDDFLGSDLLERKVSPVVK